MRDHTKSEFESNIARAKNLVGVYSSFKVSSKGRRSVGTSDVLRAAVVFTHSSIEELFRNLFKWKLPTEAPSSVLDQIPLFGSNNSGRAEKFYLGRLAEFRNEFVDNVIAKSIDAYVDVLNVNNCEQLAQNIQMIGLQPKQFQKHFSLLEDLFSRRHQIVHQADRNSAQGSGSHRASSLSVAAVNNWIRNTEDFVFDLLAAVPENQTTSLAEEIKQRAISRAQAERSPQLIDEFEPDADIPPQASATPTSATADLSAHRKTHLKARLNAKHTDRRGPTDRGV